MTTELERYKQALQRANGFLIMHDLEPVKLDYSGAEPGALNIAPIAKAGVEDGKFSWVEMLAPGLPDGEHDLFPVPLNPNGEMQAAFAPPPGALYEAVEEFLIGNWATNGEAAAFKGDTWFDEFARRTAILRKAFDGSGPTKGEAP